MINHNTEIISIEELCELLGIGNNTAYKLLGSHQIPAFRIGKTWKIPREGVDNFILEQSGLTKSMNYFLKSK